MQTPGLLAGVQAELRRRIAAYGPASVVEAADYLAPAQLDHAGLEGAILMALRRAPAP